MKSKPPARGDRNRRDGGPGPRHPGQHRQAGRPDGKPARRGPGGPPGRGPGGPSGRGPKGELPPRAYPPLPAAPPAGARLAAVDEAEVGIEKLVAGGEGLARWDGVPLFVPRSAPGDRLRVKVVERHTDYGRAEILEILEPGPGRRPDPYPELSRAGVCDLQHLEDDLQPRLKAAALRETLERLGGVELPAGEGSVELVTGEAWGYRLRTQLHTETDPVTGGVRVGYHARGTNEVIAVTRCPLLVPALEAVLPGLPALLVDRPLRRLDLAAGDDGSVTSAPVVPGLDNGDVSVTVDGIVYAFDARCFFQSHRGLLGRLVERTVGGWTGEEAFDLYGGVGLFSLPLAKRYGRVVSVESDRIAARHARNNARRNRLEGVEVIPQQVESWISRLPSKPARVIVDPPRGGLTSIIRRSLLERRPERLTYVSCHPATLARDLRHLKTIYDIERLSLFDLFPQTGHMEAVVQMVLR